MIPRSHLSNLVGRRALGLAFASLLTFAIACGRDRAPALAPGAFDGPIVVVTVDTLRADHLGCYGYLRDTSPFLDAFAGEALLFERAFTTMATTLPAHFSLWTSLHPLQTGVLANAKRLNLPPDGSIHLFAELISGLGYRTAAVVSANPVRKRTGIGGGFGHYDEPRKGQRRADETTDRALRWIDSAPDGRFFLWVHYFDPHWPWDPPGRYREAFRADARLEEYLQRLGFPDPKDPEIHQVHDLYDGEVRFVDAQIERLFGRLEERDLYDGAALVVTSDHGEGLGQHHWMQHGKIYNEQLLVPLLIKLPRSLGIAAGRVSDLASLIDVVPTLVESLGLEVPAEAREQFEGRNLLDTGTAPRFAFAQRTVTPRTSEWGPGQQYGLVGREWKYLYATQGEDELFDLEQDPHETRNLLRRDRRQAERLKVELLDTLSDLTERKRGLQALQETSPEALQELRALGYLD